MKINTVNLLNTHLVKIFRTYSLGIVAIFFYALTLYWLVNAYQNGVINQSTFFNSDALFFPSLFKNIFLEGKHFSDWTLPPSSYLFPDALLYSVAYMISKQILIQIIIFSVLQSLVLFSLVWALLAHFLRPANAIFNSALISSNIILFGITFGEPYDLSFISAFHFGSLLSFLILLLLLVEYLTVTSARRKKSIATLTILIALSAAISDNLILIQFFAPILLIGLITTDKKRLVLKFGWTLVVGYLLAYALKPLLPEMGRLDVGFGSISHQSQMVAHWLMAQPTLIQLSIIIWPTSLYFALLFLYRSKNDKSSGATQKRTLALLIIVSSCLGVLAVGLSNRDFTSRYLLPYLILSPAFLFIFLRDNYRWLLSVYLLCSSLLAILVDLDKDGAHPVPYPEYVQCIENLARLHGVSNGIAQYWDAIPLYVFNNAGLKVVPVIDDGSPMRWIYNTKDFEGQFSFVVIDNKATGPYRISKVAIERLLANKPLEYHCHDRTVLFFNNEKIALPKQSALSNIRGSALESFIKNPRALLIMSREQSAKGNHEASVRLLAEAISLLRQSGAREDVIEDYKSQMEESSVKK